MHLSQIWLNIFFEAFSNMIFYPRHYQATTEYHCVTSVKTLFTSVSVQLTRWNVRTLIIFLRPSSRTVQHHWPTLFCRLLIVHFRQPFSGPLEVSCNCTNFQVQQQPQRRKLPVSIDIVLLSQISWKSSIWQVVSSYSVYSLRMPARFHEETIDDVLVDDLRQHRYK